jgi:hypothetical protein
LKQSALTEPLVDALIDSMEDPKRCFDACIALEAATAKSSHIHARIVDAGGIEAIVDAMTPHETHETNAQIQLVACHTLQHLSSSSSYQGADKVAEAGGCKAIALALSGNYCGDPLLVQAAAHALEIIAFGGPRGRERTVRHGAIEALLAALKMHRTSVDVCQAGLAALQAIVEKDPDCQQAERFAKANGISNIVSTLGEHKSDKQVQYWGRLLLHSLCEDNRDLKAEAMRKLHYQGIDLTL